MNEIDMVTPLGTLSVVETYLEYDGPRICACESRAGQTYLGIWVEEEPQAHEWLFVPVSKRRLSIVRCGQIALREAVVRPEDGWLWRVVFSIGQGGRSTAAQVTPDSLDPEQLPSEDFRLDLPDDRLPTVTDEPATEATQARREVVYLFLKDGLSEWHEVPVDHASRFLGSAQALTRTLGYEDAMPYGQLPSWVVEQNTLMLTGMVNGSIGFRLESKERDNIFGQTPASNAVERLMALLSGSDDAEAFRKMLRTIRPRAAVRYREVLRSLRDAGMSLRAKWGSPRNTQVTVFLDLPKVRSALEVLEEQGDTFTERFTLHGRLEGLNWRKGKFEFVDDAGRAYRGKYLPGFLQGHALTIYEAKGVFGQAEIEETEIVSPLGVAKYKHTLLTLTPDGIPLDDQAAPQAPK